MALEQIDPNNIQTSLNNFTPGPTAGNISLGSVSASGVLFLSAGAGNITASNLNATVLAIDGAHGSAELFGTVGGTGGLGAAQIVLKSGEKENAYRINNCAIGSVSCIVVPRFVPTAPPTTLNVFLIEPTRAPDDTNLQAFSVGDEDLLQ